MDPTSTNNAVSETGLSDLMASYWQAPDLPEAEWLRRLEFSNPVVGIQSLSHRTQIAKRLVDILGASLLLVTLFPVMVIVGLLVKLTSRGAIFYRQVRTGLNQRTSSDRRRVLGAEVSPERRHSENDRRNDGAYGKPFVLYKFRTMCVDAERTGAQFAVKGDPRVTKLGRILRRTRLDELPQLWNVIRGEMSLVGPRPERPEFVEKLSDEIPNYLMRLGMKPGLTGLAQVLNGYDNDLEGFRRKVTFDLLYLQNCCVWNDLKILIRTVSVVVTGKGAL